MSACVVGLCLKDDRQDVVRSADFAYSGIRSSFPGIGSISYEQNGIAIFIPRIQPEPVSLSVDSIKAHISVRVSSNFRCKPPNQSFSTRSEPIVSVTPSEPKSLAWFVELANRFENFFSLCLGTSVRLNILSVDLNKDESGWLILPRPGVAEKPRPEFWIRSDSAMLGRAITAWLSTPEEFQPLENLVYGTIRNSGLFVETEFLSLAQAVESLHRLTDRTCIADSATFKKILRSVYKFIETSGTPPALAARLLDSIRHSNEPSFKDRTESLLSRLTKDRAETLLGDLVKFEETLRHTRNHLTHPGIPKKRSVLTDGKEIFLFSQKLHALLRLLMLLAVGFPEELAFEPTFQQSRRWS